MSCSDIFAEPMLDGEENLEEYLEQINDLAEQGMLPDLEKDLEYKVYTIRGSSFGAHESVILTTDDKHFVSVELGFITETDGRKHIYPVSKKIKKSSRSKMEYKGQITTKGVELIDKALEVMKQFGAYCKFSKNCQDFCNYYLKAIGLGDTTGFTDSDIADMATGSLIRPLLNFLGKFKKK